MFPTLFSLAEILVLAGTAGAGGMPPPTSARISARLKCVHEHSSPLGEYRKLGRPNGFVDDYPARIGVSFEDPVCDQ